MQIDAEAVVGQAETDEETGVRRAEGDGPTAMVPVKKNVTVLGSNKP